MANQAISALPAATTVATADTLVVVQGGVTKKATVSLLPAGAATGGTGYNLASLNGMLEAAGDVAMFTGNATGTSGVPYLVKIPWRTTGVITNVHLYLAIAGATLTGCYAGVYDSTGALLGATADQSTNWTTGGNTEKKMALTTPTASITGGASTFLWVAILVGSAATSPAFAKIGVGTSAQANFGTTAATSRWGGLAGGATTLPATFTPSTIAPDLRAFFAGVS